MIEHGDRRDSSARRRHGEGVPRLGKRRFRLHMELSDELTQAHQLVEPGTVEGVREQ